MEGKIDDRSLKIINANSNGTNLKQLLFKIDQDEIERLKELHMTEEKQNVSEGNMSAMKFLA